MFKPLWFYRFLLILIAFILFIFAGLENGFIVKFLFSGQINRFKTRILKEYFTRIQIDKVKGGFFSGIKVENLSINWITKTKNFSLRINKLQSNLTYIKILKSYLDYGRLNISIELWDPILLCTGKNCFTERTCIDKILLILESFNKVYKVFEKISNKNVTSIKIINGSIISENTDKNIQCKINNFEVNYIPSEADVKYRFGKTDSIYTPGNINIAGKYNQNPFYLRIDNINNMFILNFNLSNIIENQPVSFSLIDRKNIAKAVLKIGTLLDVTATGSVDNYQNYRFAGIIEKKLLKGSHVPADILIFPLNKFPRLKNNFINFFTNGQFILTSKDSVPSLFCELKVGERTLVTKLKLIKYNELNFIIDLMDNASWSGIYNFSDKFFSTLIKLKGINAQDLLILEKKESETELDAVLNGNIALYGPKQSLNIEGEFESGQGRYYYKNRIKFNSSVFKLKGTGRYIWVDGKIIQDSGFLPVIGEVDLYSTSIFSNVNVIIGNNLEVGGLSFEGTSIKKKLLDNLLDIEFKGSDKDYNDTQLPSVELKSKLIKHKW